MIKILAIGNSFSQDATHYLHQIAAADRIETTVVNLYIGGCNLERHWNNIKADASEYLLEINGISTDRYISIRSALEMEEWDYIITQQASHDSGREETYEPFLGQILSYLKEQKPSAEILLQETWAYESDSMHPGFVHYHQSQKEMYEKLSAAYRKEAENHGLRLIPCGDIIQRLREKEPFLYGHGGMSICRDGFHMNVIYGRYLLAATWYKVLSGKMIMENTYLPHTDLAPNAICDISVLKIVKETIDEYVNAVSCI